MRRSQIRVPCLVPLNIMCRSLVYNQKGPLILRTPHLVMHGVYSLGFALPKMDMEAQKSPAETVGECLVSIACTGVDSHFEA